MPKILTLKSFPLRSTPLMKGRTPVEAISDEPKSDILNCLYFGTDEGGLFFYGLCFTTRLFDALAPLS